MDNLTRELYEREAGAALKERFGLHNPMQIPRLDKIVLSMGLGAAGAAGGNSALIDYAMNDMAKITGQRPSPRAARKHVSNFKIRAGARIGCMVTLRRQRMYAFYHRLVKIALPQIRDFRGVNPNSFDGRGNYAMGLTEQIIFPEISYDDMEQTLGMNIVIATTASTDEHARELLRLLGMPFRDDISQTGREI
ncbi:MAG: 50S ribosomal protein L5 [Candidatus Poribacteria bacterium]|nr:50S ribosomal protein L5 [Candidatus Poribacteria bacterium]